jgi:hypothetical protein
MKFPNFNKSVHYIVNQFFECMIWSSQAVVSGVRLSPLRTAATTGLLYQPQMIDDGDCREIGGMKIGTGNRSTRRKSASAPLCPPQIPHDQTRARTRAAAMGRQWLTAWAMARPQAVVMKSPIFWDISPCSPWTSTEVSEEHVASIFRVEE